jgi:hypothetical protein
LDFLSVFDGLGFCWFSGSGSMVIRWIWTVGFVGLGLFAVFQRFGTVFLRLGSVLSGVGFVYRF